MGLFDLLRMGHRIADLMDCHEAAEFYAIGIPATHISTTYLKDRHWPAVGFSAMELKQGGYSAKDLKACGYEPPQLLALGYSAKEVIGGGYALEKLVFYQLLEEF